MTPRRGPDLEQTQAWVTGLVRAGLDAPGVIRHQVVDALVVDHPEHEPGLTAATLIAMAIEGWIDDALAWPQVTDYDRLQTVFTELESGGVVVLQGCADHWAARDELARHDPAPRGIVWFTAPDVWHAVSDGMLEVNLWHGTTANAAPGDELLDEVLARFEAAGLGAKFDEGRIEVAAYWQRRPPVLTR